jgi:hypothetical protein
VKCNELIYVILIALIGFLCLACGIQASEDAQDEELVVPVCKIIKPAETHRMNFSVESDLGAASFLMDWGNTTSDLEMTLITPSDESINSSTGEPVDYFKEGPSLYYIVPNPEAGEWVVEITPKEIPESGEEYCAYVVFNYEEVSTSDNPFNLSDEVMMRDVCEECNSSNLSNSN